MKKIFKYSLFALTGLFLAACNEDYKDWASPISYPQEDAVSIPGFTATASGAIDLNNANDTVTVFTLSDAQLPEGATLTNVRMIVSPEGGDAAQSVTLNPVSNAYGFLKSELQSLVVDFFGPRPDARSLQAQVLADVVLNGQAALVDAGTLALSITAKAPKIAPKYFLIGGPMDWAQSAASKSQVFEHSAQDVYSDPVFTYMMPSTGGEMWFAFGDEEACDAIVAGDWSKLFGTKGDSKDLSGSFDYRYNLGGDHSFCVDGSATFYRISINMMEMTYEITPIVLASQYYMVGGLQGWSDSKKTCLFTPEGNNIQSYTTKWTGAWDLKIWAAADFGNWDAAYGCPVDGDNSPSGTLTNSRAGAISAPSAEFYKFTIDMNTFTYTWTKLDNQSPTEYTNISLIGEFNGWGGDFELEQVTPHNWYAIFTQETDGQLKFRANHDWSVNWGFGSDNDWNVTEGTNKIGSNGAGNIFVPAGTYAVYLNDITSSMMFIAQ